MEIAEFEVWTLASKELVFHIWRKYSEWKFVNMSDLDWSQVTVVGSKNLRPEKLVQYVYVYFIGI